MPGVHWHLILGHLWDTTYCTRPCKCLLTLQSPFAWVTLLLWGSGKDLPGGPVYAVQILLDDGEQLAVARDLLAGAVHLPDGVPVQAVKLLLHLTKALQPASGGITSGTTAEASMCSTAGVMSPSLAKDLSNSGPGLGIPTSARQLQRCGDLHILLHAHNLCDVFVIDK